MIKKPQIHFFVCENLRDAPRRCCGATFVDARSHLKVLINSSSDFNTSSIRVSRSGCLGVCADGPAITVYPGGHWYAYSNLVDVEAIFNAEVKCYGSVDQLRIDKFNATQTPTS